MTGLVSEIKALIEKSGPITVAAYMDLALQHPEFGYYRRKDPIGRDGDFITAPEISQMFGEMIGLWCADLWRQMGQPDKIALLELGPGHGTLLSDALHATAKIPGFHDALQLCLVESSDVLRKMQKEKLAEKPPTYIEGLSDLPPLPLLVIANEFFDALPVRQFEKTFQGWYERMVTVEKNALTFILQPVDPMLTQLIPAPLQDANPGTVYEASLPSITLTRALAKHIVQYSGAALFIDYGYPEPSGRSTLQAVSGHTSVDALAQPGDVDLTAHVDFGRLKNIAEAQGAKTSGPLGQGEFLQTLGIELRAIQLKQRATPQQAHDIEKALHRLIDPSEMGTLFKVMAIASPNLPALAGF